MPSRANFASQHVFNIANFALAIFFERFRDGDQIANAHDPNMVLKANVRVLAKTILHKLRKRRDAAGRLTNEVEALRHGGVHFAVPPPFDILGGQFDAR